MATARRAKAFSAVQIMVAGGVFAWAQSNLPLQRGVQTDRHRVVASEPRPQAEENMVERAITAICTERTEDPARTIPIDEMATKAPLPLNDPRVVAGRKRAQRLLPVAKRLVPQALKRLAGAHDLEAVNLGWILARVDAVNSIKVEMGKRDNASWSPSDPHAIVFGTIFLSGLRSDEATIAVLAHELTHAVNGTEQTLQPLFMRLGARASQLTGSSVGVGAVIELTCEMVGLQVTWDFIGRVEGETTKQRLARVLEKNCVDLDLADESHLSPRETMKLLLRLKPEFAAAIVTAEENGRPPKKKE